MDSNTQKPIAIGSISDFKFKNYEKQILIHNYRVLLLGHPSSETLKPSRQSAVLSGLRWPHPPSGVVLLAQLHEERKEAIPHHILGSTTFHQVCSSLDIVLRGRGA